MSIFAKRLSTLKAGTGIRLTSSSGRTSSAWLRLLPMQSGTTT